jgi:hypothetical protein
MHCTYFLGKIYKLFFKIYSLLTGSEVAESGDILKICFLSTLAK